MNVVEEVEKRREAARAGRAGRAGVTAPPVARPTLGLAEATRRCVIAALVRTAVETHIAARRGVAAFDHVGLDHSAVDVEVIALVDA